MTMFRLVFIFFGLSMSLNAQVTFYVAPSGSDSNNGYLETPLASLKGARNAIRNHKVRSKTKQSYIVIVNDGTYTMAETFELEPEDSGTEKFPIIYRAAEGAKPIFSGGKIIEGFSVNKKGIWEIEIPESLYYKWQFDQLYVNGKRAVLAKTPNEGFLKIDTVKQNIWEKGDGKIALRAQQKLFFDTNTFKYLHDIPENAIDEVRFKAYHKWDFTLRHIDAINTDSSSITTSGKGMKPWNKLKRGRRIIFENYKAALDAPREWFLSKKGVLYYVPKSNETLNNTKIVAPVLEQLITIKGNASQDTYVEYIQMEGLTFEYCHYQIPRTGFEPNQAATLLSAAIHLEGVRNVAISNCEISKTGQHAIKIAKGCSDVLVENTYMYNLGGGGVYLGDLKALDGNEHTHHITLNNNILQSGGQEFPSAVGIWVGHSSDNKIIHNDIGNFYYTGISVGWVWGYAPSVAKRNVIAYNHIHHLGWDLLSDMAGIYTLGTSEGTVVQNNLIHDVHAYSYGGWGLYADEGSSKITFKNNLVYNTKTGGFQQNYGKDNSVQNNILAFAKKYQMQCTISEEHNSFTFTNNIIVFKEGMVAKGAWDDVIAKIDKNIYWNVNGGDYDFNNHKFKAWKRLGFDKNSLMANPYFKDAEHFDFKFQKTSNYKKIQFKPFNYSEAGVYGETSWINKAKLPKAVVSAFNKAVETNIKMNIKR